MKPPIAPLIFCLLALAGSAPAEQAQSDQEAAKKAALIEKIRDRIIWYDEARTQLHLIPEDVIGLLPPTQMPIPRKDQEALSAAIHWVRDWRSPTGLPFPSCSYPTYHNWNYKVPEEKQISIEAAVAEGPVSVLVSIDRTTNVWWPGEGVFQFNEVAIVKFLRGEDFPYTDPRSTRAFLSAGGEMVVEGARLCTTAPWHAEPTHRGEVYLLIGAPDESGIFHANFYFKIDDGFVVWANYKSVRRPASRLALKTIEQALAKLAGEP